ncbi:hypothetical protein BDZ85DRAFT_265932 [Elsinoe ampelina]|uniref:Uncharacterized protein n=1 Tax=Elsinoe ampelina TaxID=302913 RepID=A0A6A6G533_9PEZI|nr:hypothetical protein BDZ85DRAFT_265932 [Elsinoe ampelina]
MQALPNDNSHGLGACSSLLLAPCRLKLCSRRSYQLCSSILVPSRPDNVTPCTASAFDRLSDSTLRK